MDKTTSARKIILEAGFTTFLSHGYDGTGITLLLAGTGLSKGAFYHHFESKFALYEEVIRHYFPSPFSAVNWNAHAKLSVAEQQDFIAEFYQEHIQTSAEIGGDLNRYFALFFDSLSRLEGFRHDVNETYTRLISCLADAFTREDYLSASAADTKARTVIAGFEGQLYLWAVTGAKPVIQKET